MNKTLFLIRHGHALHNELFHKMGVKAFRIPEVIDSPLTQKGIQQAQQLEKEWTNKKEISDYGKTFGYDKITYKCIKEI